MQEVTSNQKSRDKRAEYPSGPWLSVSRFDMHTEYTQDYNLINTRIPENTPPGEYVYMYSWKGFQDCVDILVLPENTPVAPGLRYAGKKIQSNGQPAAPTPVVYTQTSRKEHCEFNGVRDIATDCMVAPNGDAGKCVQACLAAGFDKCTAVATVPYKNPARTWPLKLLEFNMIPETKYVAGDAKCGYNTIHERKKKGCTTRPSKQCNMAQLNAKDDDMICFGLKPYLIKTEVTLDHLLTKDPLDPMFYGTCMFITEKFDGLPRPTPEDWRVGGQCLKCGATGPNKVDSSTAFNWAQLLVPDGKCIDCGR